jgi:hypothetical protein
MDSGGVLLNQVSPDRSSSQPCHLGFPVRVEFEVERFEKNFYFGDLERVSVQPLRAIPAAATC